MNSKAEDLIIPTPTIAELNATCTRIVNDLIGRELLNNPVSFTWDLYSLLFQSDLWVDITTDEVLALAALASNERKDVSPANASRLELLRLAYIAIIQTNWIMGYKADSKREDLGNFLGVDQQMLEELVVALGIINSDDIYDVYEILAVADLDASTRPQTNLYTQALNGAVRIISVDLITQFQTALEARVLD